MSYKLRYFEPTRYRVHKRKKKSFPLLILQTNSEAGFIFFQIYKQCADISTMLINLMENSEVVKQFLQIAEN